MAEVPELTILLLGDPDCGKLTFLEYVSSSTTAFSVPDTKSTGNFHKHSSKEPETDYHATYLGKKTSP
jgi:hypothetical protein